MQIACSTIYYILLRGPLARAKKNGARNFSNSCRTFARGVGAYYYFTEIACTCCNDKQKSQIAIALLPLVHFQDKMPLHAEITPLFVL